MLEKEFVTYEIAKELKELGFSKKCLGTYDYKQFIKMDYQSGEDYDINYAEDCDDIYDYLCPLYQQVIDWLIKEHNLFIDIFKWPVKYYINDELQSPRFLFDIDTYNDYSDDWIYQSINDDLKYKTYQEAREAAIIKCIEIIKNENNEQGK